MPEVGGEINTKFKGHDIRKVYGKSLDLQKADPPSRVRKLLLSTTHHY